MSTVTLKSAREHRVTVPAIARMKRRGEPIRMLTAYDHTFARIFDSGFSAPTIDMGTTRGIAKLLPKVGEHGFEHALVKRSRGVMIEVDRPFRPRRTARSHRYSMRWDSRS